MNPLLLALATLQCTAEPNTTCWENSSQPTKYSRVSATGEGLPRNDRTDDTIRVSLIHGSFFHMEFAPPFIVHCTR